MANIQQRNLHDQTFYNHPINVFTKKVHTHAHTYIELIQPLYNDNDDDDDVNELIQGLEIWQNVKI